MRRKGTTRFERWSRALFSNVEPAEAAAWGHASNVDCESRSRCRCEGLIRVVVELVPSSSQPRHSFQLIRRLGPYLSLTITPAWQQRDVEFSLTRTPLQRLRGMWTMKLLCPRSPPRAVPQA